MKRSYFVGLTHSGHTAIFQYRRCVDFLDCELIKFYGLQEITKAEARRELGEHKREILTTLRAKYPKYNFQYVVID